FLQRYDDHRDLHSFPTRRSSDLTLNQLSEFHEESNAKGTILTAIAEDPAGYGRVVRQSDKEVSRIVEQKDANKEEQAITEINTGTYVFNNKALFEALDKVGNENAQGEY